MTADISFLNGKRVLVVEDEVLVAMLVEDILSEFGCAVVGPAGRLDDAVRLAEIETFDAALLDVNLGGARSFPVADVLAGRAIPFVFVSGYGDAGIEPPHQNRPVLEKPFSAETIGAALAGCLATSS